jgi:hypothetical protein
MWYIVYRYSMIERDSEVSNVVYCVPVRYDIVGGEGRPPFCIPSLSSSSLPLSPSLIPLLRLSLGGFFGTVGKNGTSRVQGSGLNC